MAGERGFSVAEVLVAMTVVVLAMGGIFGLLVQNSRINKSQQMTAAVQANARNCVAMIVNRLRSAGWDPREQGIATVALDSNLADDISEIEIFADLDGDGFTTAADEQVFFRHSVDRVLVRTIAGGSLQTVAVNISNDEDGDGTPEPMFVPDQSPDPTTITVKVTAESPSPDPVRGDVIRYTVTSDVVLRKEL
jgi:Tfp pilus assembly protein PilW